MHTFNLRLYIFKPTASYSLSGLIVYVLLYIFIYCEFLLLLLLLPSVYCCFLLLYGAPKYFYPCLSFLVNESIRAWIKCLYNRYIPLKSYLLFFKKILLYTFYLYLHRVTKWHNYLSQHNITQILTTSIWYS